MRYRVAVPALMVVTVALLAAGCARGVAVESEPAPRYALRVENAMPHPMIVSYDDGTGSRLLGTVPAGGDERFVIVDPARRSITVTATDRAETHTVRRTVTLDTDRTASVELSR